MEREVQKQCSVSFWWTNESFLLMKLSFREFNLVFFKTGRLAYFEPTKAAKFLKKLQVYSALYGQQQYVLKREVLGLIRFHDDFYILTWA